jgi:hypothetical protein
MDSVLSVLAMAGGLLILGWLVGPGNDQGKHARPGEASDGALTRPVGAFEER